MAKKHFLLALIATSFCLSAMVLSSGCNENKENKVASEEIVIIREGRCEHGHTFPPYSSAEKNEKIVFTVKVTNKTNKLLKNVTVKDTLPEGVKLVNGENKKSIAELKPGETLIMKYTINTGDPKSLLFPGTVVKCSYNGKELKAKGKDLYIDVQLDTGC